MKRAFKWIGWSLAGALLTGLLALVIVFAALAPGLPDATAAANYQPKLPLRVLSADGELLGEFGEEHRTFVPIDQIPKALRDAVVAVEDARFDSHSGIDTIGVVRAILGNLRHGIHQGASTITMQVARNLFLNPDRTLRRKLSETIIALRLERDLTKHQILEIYLNQIYLGRRAWGFAAACDTYFGKPLADITLAEAAMLAGLPKAPSANNPVANPRRARARQLYVLDRMREVGFITADAAREAGAVPVTLRDPTAADEVQAGHVAETVRQWMQARYGSDTMTHGYTVTTTIDAAEQRAAVDALRYGLLDLEARKPWRGPLRFVKLPEAIGSVGATPESPQTMLQDAVEDALASEPDVGPLQPAVVLESSRTSLRAMRRNGEIVQVKGAALDRVREALAAGAPAQLQVRRGAVVYVTAATTASAKSVWSVAQAPEAEGALVALDPHDGAIRALVGGFDFDRSSFNRATQAWRQPGSAFKPFVYSAALEAGFRPDTLISDAPLFFDATATGSQPWAPKNHDGRFGGPVTLREALEQSKNIAAVRTLQAIGVRSAQDWATRFGFDRDRLPAALPMALGAGGVTPLQMASAYAVFANGGYKLPPRLVTRIADARGNVLIDLPAPVPGEAHRAIPARNAFLVGSLLQGAVQHGTGRAAYRTLGRADLYGKTGTTNDSTDAWFAGYQPGRVAVAWVGYDSPRRIAGVSGRGETGGSLALPVWTRFMQAKLKGVPVAPASAPAGLAQVDGEWFYDEFAPGPAVPRGVATLGLEADGAADVVALAALQGKPSTPAAATAAAPGSGSRAERDRILDLFR